MAEAVSASSPPPNPFSTRFVRPDRTPYRFRCGEDVAALSSDLIAQLAERGTAAIIGPHGTGKSTLLHTLVPRLQKVFPQLDWIRLSSATNAAAELRQWQQTRPAGLKSSSPKSGTTARCLVIDGFEQLSWLTRQRLVWQTRRSQNAMRGNARRQPPPCLLVTAHRDQFAIQTVYRTGWDDALVRCMTQEKLSGLAEPERRSMLDTAERQARVMSQEGPARRNVRDYWFALYDEYERLRSHPSPAIGTRRSNAR